MIKKTILVIEYDDLVRETLEFLLQDMGYSVELVCTGEQGIQAVRRNSGFQCVITNFKRPGLDGLETISRIKQVRNNLPVILMSSYYWLEGEAKSIGADSFLEKPFTNFQLRSSLNQARISLC